MVCKCFPYGKKIPNIFPGNCLIIWYFWLHTHKKDIYTHMYVYYTHVRYVVCMYIHMYICVYYIFDCTSFVDILNTDHVTNAILLYMIMIS